MALEIVKAIDVAGAGGHQATLELCVGDVLDVSGQRPDLLVISSFPDDYYPSPGTVVEGLYRVGISVADLAADKHRDWRRDWQTWVSKPLVRGAPGKRVACFEHGHRRQPDTVVGNIFRALSELSLETKKPLGVVRMPLLSTGNQGADKFTMLGAILEQAYLRLSAGLPVKKLQVVIYQRTLGLHRLLVEAGDHLARCEYEWNGAHAENVNHDLFVSYQRQDQPFADSLVQALRQGRRDLQIFIDQEQLKTGSLWKTELIRAMQGSRHALCIVTDGYPKSVECIDEFHIARYRTPWRPGYLLPLFKLSRLLVEQLPRSISSVNGLQANCPPRKVEEVALEVLQALR